MVADSAYTGTRTFSFIISFLRDFPLGQGLCHIVFLSVICKSVGKLMNDIVEGEDRQFLL